MAAEALLSDVCDADDVGEDAGSSHHSSCAVALDLHWILLISVGSD